MENTTIKAISLPEIATNWFVFLDKETDGGQISADTSATYKRSLIKFTESGRDVYTLERENIVNWNAELLKAGMARATRSILLTGLRSFYKWAIEQKLIEADPTLGVKAGKTEGRLHKRRALSNEEMQRIFELDLSLRNKLLVRLLAYTATRNVELHRANIEDIKTVGDQLRIYIRGKGGSKSNEPKFIAILDPETRSLLRDYLSERKATKGALIVTEREYKTGARRLSRRSIREIVRDILHQAGIYDESVTAHSFRHTAITNALKNGASIREAQALARHKQVTTTEIYAHEINLDEHSPAIYLDYN